MRVPEARFTALPWMPSVREGFHRVLPAVRALREMRKACDVLVIQLPFTAPLALLSDSGPTVFHICADQRAIIRTSQYYRGAARLAALATAEGTDLVQRYASRRARLVTHGDALLRRYSAARGRSLVSSTLLAHEVGSCQRQRDIGAAFRVLFVGYMRPEKGIDVLIDAMAKLRRTHPRAELQVVGASAQYDRGAAAMLEYARERLGAAFSHVGAKSFGPELFQCYADADVLVLPSRSEGTPRVLVEARAFGCPVIASNVGGVPSSVTNGHDGILVAADDPEALAGALARLAHDEPLRRHLVAEGYRRARACTVSAMANTIVEQAAQAMSEARRPPRGRKLTTIGRDARGR